MREFSLSSVSKSVMRFAIAGILIAPIILFTGCGSGTSATDDLEAANQELQTGDLRAAVIHLKNALQKDPQLISARRTLARAYLIGGFWAGAEKEFEYAVQSKTAMPEDSDGLARVLIQQQKYPQALDLLLKQSETVNRLVLKADALSGLKKYPSAMQDYNRAIAADPTAVDAYKGRAWLNWLQGHTGKMTGDIAKALEHDPRDVEAWLMKGLLAENQKRTAQALEAYAAGLRVSRFAISRHALSTHSAMARLLLDDKKPDQAKAHIEALGKNNKSDPLYHYLNARFNYQKGDLNSAVTELRDVLKTSPKHARSLILLGALERERGNLGQAKEYLSLALSVQPASLYARQLLGLTYLASKQYPEAIGVLEPVVRTLPDDAYTWMLLGTAYMNNGNLDGATRALTRASALNPASVEIRNQLAVNYLVSGENETALNELHNAIKAEPENYQAGYLLTVTLLQKGDYQGALKEAGRLSKQQPDNAVPLNLMGAANIGLGQLDTARRLFNQAIKLDPEYLTPVLNIIKLDLKAGRVDEAMRGYGKILIQAPYNSSALLGLAELLLSQGRRSEAIERLQQARAHNPKDVKSRLTLAELRWWQGRNTEALRIVAEALALQPEEPGGLLLQARVQVQLGQLDQARASVSKLLKLKPGLTPALYQLALINIRTGQRQEALAVLRKLLQRDPQDAGAKIALSDLESQMGVAPEPRQAKLSARQTAPAGTVVDDMILIRGLLARGQYDEALAIAQAAVKRSPKSINALTLLAGVYRAKGEITLARQAFERVISLNPSSNIAELNLADLAIQAGDLQAARAYLKNVLKRDPNHVSANIGLAGLSSDAQARTLLQRALAAHPDALKPMILLAQLYLKNRQWREAITIANEGLKRVPTNETLLNVAGNAYLITGDLANAELMANRLLKLSPISVQAWLLRGKLRTLQNSFDRGREDLQKALQLEPENLRVKVMLAVLEIDAGRLGKSVAILRDVLERKPDYSMAWALMGDVNWRLKKIEQAVENYIQADKFQHSATNVIKLAKARWQTGQKVTAKELLEKWLKSHPADANVHNALGDMFMVEKKWSAASQEYEAVLKVAANNASVMSKLASAYDKQGDARAQGLLEAAYKLDENNPDILDAYGWLLVKKDQFQRGIVLLRRAVSLEEKVTIGADRATTRFHLAEAYRKSGDKNAALGELKALLSSEVSFPEKDLAELTLLRLQ